MSLYGLILGLCAVLLINYVSARNRVIPKNHENIFFFLLLFFALIGARAYHVIDQWSYYSQNPILILNTRGGGLGIIGALIAGLIFTLIYSKIYHLNFIKILDLFTPILPLTQSLGRFANFINHENPFWWLESILDFLLFLIIAKYPKNPTAKYFIGYGLLRFLTEFFRADTWTINNFKVGQLFSCLFVATGLLILLRDHRSKITPDHH